MRPDDGRGSCRLQNPSVSSQEARCHLPTRKRARGGDFAYWPLTSRTACIRLSTTRAVSTSDQSPGFMITA